MEAGAIIRVDTTTPAGRRFVRDFEKTRTRHRDKSVQIEYPMPPEIAEQEWVDAEDVWDRIERKMSAHYGVEIKIR